MVPPQRLREYKLALLRMSLVQPAFFKAWLPRDILSILFCFSGPYGCFFFLSGWVGFPLPRFLPSPFFPLAFFFSSFLLGGWVPLAAFSRCFPRASGVGWWAFLVFLRFLAISCILHLLSSRPELGKDGLPTRKPPGPPRPFPWCVCSDPSPAGSRRADAPR